MIQNAAKEIVDFQIKKGYLKDSERTKFVYAYEISINQLLNLLLTLLLVLCFGEVRGVGLFLLLYIPLRKYAGGFHAKSNEKCVLYSALVIIGVIFVNKVLTMFDYDRGVVVAIIGALMIYINLVAPVEVRGNRLGKTEKKRYKNYVHLLSAIQVGVLLINVLFAHSECIYINMLLGNSMVYTMLMMEQMEV